MAKSRLLMVMLAWGYFYLLAGIALFIVPEYTVVLGITNAEASVLMGVLGVAVGIGCAFAGLISGHQNRTAIDPDRCCRTGSVLCTLLAAIPPWVPNLGPMVRIALSNVAFFIFGAGFFAGFYIIPLQALLQKMSPDDERGRFLGTANACLFRVFDDRGIAVLGHPSDVRQRATKHFLRQRAADGRRGRVLLVEAARHGTADRQQGVQS